jgi:glycosyltransferase involved in cell wall biosynthesis
MRITGICLSRGNQEMLDAAIRNWNEQTIKARKDLVVVTDEESFKTLRVHCNRSRTVSVPVGTNLGERRNRAINFAQGDIVAVWDDDDWSDTRRLELQVAALSERCQATFLRDVTLESAERQAPCAMLSGWPQTMVAYKEAVWNVGGYPEDQRFDGDTDLCMELQGRKGGVVLELDAGLYRYRQHADNVTGSGHWDSLWEMAERGVRTISE